MFAACKAEQELIAPDLAVGAKASFKGGEVDGAVVLMDLDGVVAAEGDVGATFSAEVAEVAGGADFAGRVWCGGGDVRPLICPKVAGEQGAAHFCLRTNEIFEGLSDGDGGSEVDRGVQDSGSVAGFDGAGGRLGEDAGEARGLAGEDIHGDGVGGDCGGVDPGAVLLDGVVVDEVAGFEIVGGVEDDMRASEELMDVAWCEVGNMSADRDILVEQGDFAAGGFGFGERIAGVGLVKEDLPLEIAFFDEVPVDEGEGADTGACEEACGGSAGGSDPNEGNMGSSELLLALLANTGKEHLAGVAFGDERGRRRHESLV